jgi:hypothetical protein
MLSSDQEDLRPLRESARVLFERAVGNGRSRKLCDAGGCWDADMIRDLAEAGVFRAIDDDLWWFERDPTQYPVQGGSRTAWLN